MQLKDDDALSDPSLAETEEAPGALQKAIPPDEIYVTAELPVQVTAELTSADDPSE
jgi:hypothetical protein